MNMKGAMEYFLLFLVGVFALILIASTIVGRGIAYNFFGILVQVEPSHLQELFRTFLTVASYSPGEFEGGVQIAFQHDITLDDDPSPTILVETPQQFKFTKGDTTPTPFLTNCEIFKSCAKVCGVIGDKCSAHEDCCGVLSCDIGVCKSTTTCRNGILDEGEVCDPGPPAQDMDCPTQCQADCTCPPNYIQCNDGIDNDGDFLIDLGDPSCENSNDISEDGLIDEDCTNDNDCWRLFTCNNIIKFEKVGGTLVVKKYFEGNTCKLKIEGR